MPFGQIETLRRQGVELAYERLQGAAPTFVWFGGFKSDMTGTKAQTLAHWAKERGQAFVRFDYSGHGQSGGRFTDGTISSWRNDALAVLDQLTTGPLVLVGSSMGGWLSLLAARARPERVRGLLLIAPAPDFTERLMWATFTPEQQQTLMQVGRLELASAYASEPNVITRALIEDGRRHLIMGGPIRFSGPVRLMLGGEDPDVPTSHILALFDLLRADDKKLRTILDGGHRLSRPEDLECLVGLAADLADQLAC